MKILSFYDILEVGQGSLTVSQSGIFAEDLSKAASGCEEYILL